jgi:hypothetical protein
VKTGADGVDRNDIAGLVRAVEIDRPDDQQLFAVQALVLLRGNDGAEYASNYHVEFKA